MYRLHILQDSKSRRRGSVEMGKLSSGVSHISHQSMTCSVSRYMWYMHILTWWTHKSSLQIFSPNALQFVPGANNCGFVHRDRGRHCHNHVHNHNHYHNYNRDPGSHCHNRDFSFTETNNALICTAITTIWSASPIYQKTIFPLSQDQIYNLRLQGGGSVGQIIIDFTNTDLSCREVAVFGKEDNLVTSFTNPGFLFPCSIAFCPERKEAFILDKR